MREKKRTKSEWKKERFVERKGSLCVVKVAKLKWIYSSF